MAYHVLIEGPDGVAFDGEVERLFVVLDIKDSDGPRTITRGASAFEVYGWLEWAKAWIWNTIDSSSMEADRLPDEKE